jgi:hypothetical protein
MKKAKLIGAVLGIFVTLPIWFFILYRILDAIKAGELVWFLYWVYVPVNLLAAFLIKIGEKD